MPASKMRFDTTLSPSSQGRHLICVGFFCLIYRIVMSNYIMSEIFAPILATYFYQWNNLVAYLHTNLYLEAIYWRNCGRWCTISLTHIHTHMHMHNMSLSAGSGFADLYDVCRWNHRWADGLKLFHRSQRRLHPTAGGIHQSKTSHVHPVIPEVLQVEGLHVLQEISDVSMLRHWATTFSHSDGLAFWHYCSGSTSFWPR